jgi:hypothetical protein
MKKIFLSIVSGLLFFSSCKKDEAATPPASTTDPKAGSIWVFKYTSYNEAGTVTGTSNVSYLGVEVSIGGSTWISLVNQSNSTAIIAIQKRAEGWWYNPLPGTTSSLWCKYPAAVNDSYPYVYGNCTVKDINASFTVPAGVYTGTYFVEGHDTNSLEDEFWFTNTGAVLVKFNTYDQKAAGPASNVYRKESMELISFTR